MLTDYMEIRNFFDDPYEILNLAKRQTFVLRDAHYHNPNRDTYYNGVRSKALSDIDEQFDDKFFKQLFDKVAENRFKDDIGKIRLDYVYDAQAYFHIMREEDKFNDEWVHKDDKTILAGLVYLNPNPLPNTGTAVHRYGDDKDAYIVENEFNKLVMYNASWLHSPQAGFGTDINDSRLTLVFFMRDIGFRAAFADQIKDKLV